MLSVMAGGVTSQRVCGSTGTEHKFSRCGSADGCKENGLEIFYTGTILKTILGSERSRISDCDLRKEPNLIKPWRREDPPQPLFSVEAKSAGKKKERKQHIWVFLHRIRVPARVYQRIQEVDKEDLFSLHDKMAQVELHIQSCCMDLAQCQ